MAETVLNSQEQKLDQPIDSPSPKASGPSKRAIGIVLSIIMIALTAYVYNLQNQNLRLLADSNELTSNALTAQTVNYRSYVKQYTDTKAQLEETTRKLEEVNRQLDKVSAELNATKGLLNETNTMLGQVQAENGKLKEEIQGLESLRTTENVGSVAELETKIDGLKSKNTQVTVELDNLKSELRAFEAEFSNLEEGGSLISLFQNKIKLVKSRMRYLQQEAYFAKLSAQKEKDRISALNGNSGFLWRNGKLQKTGNAKSFAIDVKIVQ